MNALPARAGGVIPGLVPSRFAALGNTCRGSRYSDGQQGASRAAALTVIRGIRRQP